MGITNLNFEYCAIPEINFSEVSPKEEYIMGGKKISIEPIAVIIDNEKEIKSIKDEYHTDLFYNKKKNHLVYSTDKNYRENVLEAAIVEDGLMAARCIRLSILPCIRKRNIPKLKNILEQLKIVMFLTNSKNINELKNAKYSDSIE